MSIPYACVGVCALCCRGEVPVTFHVRTVRRVLFSDFRCLVSVRYIEKPPRLPEFDHDVDAASLFNLADGVVTDKARTTAAQRGVAQHRATRDTLVLPEVRVVAAGRVGRGY